MREMKDSRVEWIGEIPKNWDVMKLLFVLRRSITDGPHETPNLVESQEGIPFISVDSLSNTKQVDLSIVKKYISVKDYKEYRKKAFLEKGDVLFTKAATIGKTAIVDNPTEYMIWSPIAILKPNEKCFNEYLYYILNCKEAIKYTRDIIGHETTQVNVGMRDLEKLKIPIAPFDEQKRIAIFLDSKCEAIDQAIQKQKDIVNKLIEYKQSVITQAVTKGLNPSVEMKNTPISGLTQIPKTWNIVPLKTLFSFSKGLSITKSDLTDEGIKVISYGQIHSKKCDGVHATNELIRFTAEKFKSNNSLAKCGSFIFADTSEDLEGCGNAIYITNEVYGGYHTVILNPKETHDYRYLAYLFKTDAWRTELRKQLTEVKVFSVTQFALKNMHVILPSYEEMVQIADFLDSKCLKINKSIERSNKIIQKLEEYKKALIYNAVTGKIDCRNA